MSNNNNDVCPYIFDMLQEHHRKAALMYLKGTKRDAMNMAFDRARDQQVEIVNKAVDSITDADQSFVRKVRKDRDQIVAKAVDKANDAMARKLNRHFKRNHTPSWWDDSTGRYGHRDWAASFVRITVGDQITAIRTKLNEFRKSLNPQHPEYAKPLAPADKAKVTKKTNSAAVKLLETFTDTLSEQE